MKFNLEGLDVVRARSNERTMRYLASRRRARRVDDEDEDEDDASRETRRLED